MGCQGFKLKPDWKLDELLFLKELKAELNHPFLIHEAEWYFF